MIERKGTYMIRELKDDHNNVHGERQGVMVQKDVFGLCLRPFCRLFSVSVTSYHPQLPPYNNNNGIIMSLL